MNRYIRNLPTLRFFNTFKYKELDFDKEKDYLINSLKIVDVIHHTLQKFLIFFPVIFALEYLFGHLLVFAKVFDPQRIEVLWQPVNILI